jgi:methylthioribulose-1-phosphate dehydratase
VRLSATDAPLVVAMSPSGQDKSTLFPEAFIRVGADGRPFAPDVRKPSDETALHLSLYELTEVGAVCHGHPPHAVALSLDHDHVITVRGIEMQKAFAGTTTHACERRLPIIENSQDMTDLIRDLAIHRVPEVPAVIVRGHGVYAWGRSPAEAGRHLETVEWLCRITWLRLAIPQRGL